MRIVVIGGTGLIGSKIVRNLTDHGHEAVAASLDSGVDEFVRLSQRALGATAGAAERASLASGGRS